MVPVAARWLPFALFAVALQERSFKLSGPLPATVGGDVEDLLVSPDGTRVVYRADPRHEGAYQLLAAPVDGSAPPLALAGPIAPWASVQAGYRLSPDGQWVAYRADTRVDEAFELFAAPLDGHAPARRLSRELTAGGTVLPEFAITADSTRVVFLSDGAVDERFVLYSAPLDGSAPAQALNGPLVPNGDVHWFRVAPQGLRVVYVADQDTHNVDELYSVPADLSQPAVKLNDGAGEVYDVEIGPDGARAVYVQLRTGGSVELRSRVLDASSPSVLLDGSGTFEFTPDGSSIVFARGSELRRQPVDGSSPSLSLRPPVGSLHAFHVSRDGARVAYLADQDVPGRIELYSVPVDGSAAPVRVSGPVLPGGNVVEFEITSDSTRVVYLADASVFRRYDLASASILGGSEAALYADLPWSGTRRWRLGADGARVVFPDHALGLSSMRVDGTGVPLPLNDPLVAGGVVRDDFQLTPDATRVLYRADQDELGVVELFAASLSAQGSTQVNGEFQALFPLGRVEGFVQTEAFAAYVADQEVDDRFELFGVPARGGASFPLSAGAVASAPRVTADGTGVLYLSSTDLYRTRLDGSGTPVRLNGALVPGGAVREYALSADGARVAYLADQRVDETVELFAGRSDGSAAAARLSGALVPGGDVTACEVSPDGTRVVYRADQDADELFELYSADGRSPPVKLDSTPVPFGDVALFRISPDGTRVAFLGDLLVDGRAELFSAPIDGSSPAVVLNGPLVNGGDVQRFALAPVGARVVYAADEDADNVLELFVAPLDGSAPPVKLSPGGPVSPQFELSPEGQRVAFVGAGLYSARLDGVVGAVLLDPGVSGFTSRFSPDGTRIAYLGTYGSERELRLVAADGSASPMPLDRFIDTTEFRFTPDGKHLVYTRARDWFGLFLPYDLFAVRLDGASAPARLSGRMVGGGSVSSFSLSPHGTRVLYLADQEFDGVPELFASYVEKAPRPVR